MGGLTKKIWDEADIKAIVVWNESVWGQHTDTDRFYYRKPRT